MDRTCVNIKLQLDTKTSVVYVNRVEPFQRVTDVSTYTMKSHESWIKQNVSYKSRCRNLRVD